MAEDIRPKKHKRSLLDFERDKRRAACPVCVLPQDIRAQLRVAKEKKIPQAIVLEWLRGEHAITLARQDFVVHGAAHHDQWEAEG